MKTKPECSCATVPVNAFLNVPMYRDPACPTHGDSAMTGKLDRLADVLDTGAAEGDMSPGMDDVSLVERIARAARDEEEGERMADNDHDGLG